MMNPAPAPLHPPVFVGRSKEMALLKEMTDGAASGRGGMALIQGEAGTGKTRIVEETVAYAEKKGFEVLRGRCLFLEGGRPYMPFVESIERYQSRHDTRQRPQALDIPMGLMVMEGLKGEKERKNYTFERDRLFEGMADFFDDLSSANGALFILTDMHLADASTLSLLLYLLKGVPSQKLLFLGTFRNDVAETAQTARSIQDLMGRIRTDASVKVIGLGNLERDDAIRAMNSMVDKTLPDRLADWIFVETGGNPHFIEMVIESLNNEGILALPDPDVGKIKIPQTVSAVIARRFERFSETERRVLDYMAVVGHNIAFELVRRMMQMDEDTLVDIIDVLLRAGVIKEEKGGDHYLFTQMVYREVLYNQMGTEKRKLFHQKVAEVLLDIYSGREDRIAFALAYHCDAAGDSERAMQYYHMAADLCLGNFAFLESVDYYKKALALLRKAGVGDRGELETEMLIGLAESTKASGSWTDAMVYYLEAVERIGGDRPLKVRAYKGLGDLAMERTEWKEARSYLEMALALSESMKLGRKMAEIYNSLAWITWKTGDFEGTHKNTDRAREFAERYGDQRAQANADIILGNAYSDILVDYPKSIELFQRALTIAESINDWETIARASNNLGFLYSEKREYKTAIELFNKVRAIAENMGSLLYKGLSHSNMGHCQVLLGDSDNALENLNKALTYYRKLDQKHFIAFVYRNMGMAHANRRDWAQAERFFEDARRIQEERGLKLDMALTLQQVGKMWRERADRDKAREFLTKARTIFEELKSTKNAAESEMMLGEL
jgi:tetratricopeptide (TPR) repeat protein